MLVEGRDSFARVPRRLLVFLAVLTASLAALADYRVERVFPGHGCWSPRLAASDMRQRLLELVERM